MADTDNLNVNALSPAAYASAPPAARDDIDLGTLLAPVRRRWRETIAVGFAAGALGYAASFLMTPIYAGVTTFLPPQQQQSGASAALASLGSLGSLAGGALKSPAEQYVSLMQSVTVADRIIEKFKLRDVYNLSFQDATRLKLAKSTQIVVGKKDGMIYVEVDDPSPQRAADLANQYVVELQHMTGELAISEAQQRRVFFEKQLQATKTRLAEAQAALQGSGFTAGALNTEPKAAADAYARLRAELTSGEVRLSTLRNSLAETAPEVRQQIATVNALSSQLQKLEQSATLGQNSPDYIGKYREFKYQETLFDLMARQYEVARVDESREGELIQVVDYAKPAEHRERPRRSRIAMASAVFGALLFSFFVIRHERRRTTH